jgi:flagellar hook protein FlgE
MALTSFYTALTGMNNNSIAINVIGDNLSNMNTTAFKSAKVVFSEVLAGMSGTSANGNPIVNGLGSSISGIAHSNTQGTPSYTGNPTDAAINGNGLFMVDTDGGLGYTRAGKFELDKLGNLLNADGYAVLGYQAVDGVIDINSDIVPVHIMKAQTIPGNATTQIDLPGNIDNQSNAATASVQIYDSLGVSHNLTLTFTGTGSTRTWSATLPAIELGGAEDDDPTEVGTGDLSFNGIGKLTQPVENPTFKIQNLTSGANDMDITLGLWNKSGLPVLTNLANGSSNFTPAQNGSGSSIIKDIKIDSTGVILGVTESGNTIAMAQLSIADFPNIDGLQKYKGSTFIGFPAAGDPSIGVAGSGGRGVIVGGSLEQSNVDMSQEFVSLIVAQRAYLANSKIITTTDELYQDSLNLKR